MHSSPNILSYALFSGLIPEDAALLSSSLKPQQFSEGAYLFRKGDEADRLFLIEQGSVEVLNDLSDDTQVQLAIRQEGDSVGEIGLIDSAIRTASVRALEPVRVLAFSYRQLNELRRTQKDLFIQILINIAREVSRRLASDDAVISSSLFGRADLL